MTKEIFEYRDKRHLSSHLHQPMSPIALYIFCEVFVVFFGGDKRAKIIQMWRFLQRAIPVQKNIKKKMQPIRCIYYAAAPNWLFGIPRDLALSALSEWYKGAGWNRSVGCKRLSHKPWSSFLWSKMATRLKSETPALFSPYIYISHPHSHQPWDLTHSTFAT